MKELNLKEGLFAFLLLTTSPLKDRKTPLVLPVT